MWGGNWESRGVAGRSTFYVKSLVELFDFSKCMYDFDKNKKLIKNFKTLTYRRKIEKLRENLNRWHLSACSGSYAFLLADGWTFL